MDFDEVRAKIVAESKKTGRVIRDGAAVAELAWNTLGSPVPVPQPPNLDSPGAANMTWQTEHPDSTERLTQDIVDHDMSLQELRRREAFESSLTFREPQSREERPREKRRERG